MSKLRILALLFYNIVAVISFPSEQDATYDDSGNDARFDMLALMKAFGEKSNEYRRETMDRNLENWTGRWMPDRPGDPTPPPKVLSASLQASQHMEESHNRLSMGLAFPGCDNGKSNLTVDWDNSPVNYTCYGRKIMPDFRISPVLYSEPIPPAYMAPHKCMSESIEYNSDIPLFGAHRPVWPVYGEYKFLPKQRWLHSLEHGGVVMLYHPCANPLEVKRLKTLVTNCLRRHVISSYNLLSEDRSLSLLTWGYHLSMSYVNPDIATKFIREHSLRGPEAIPGDGQFQEGLISIANTVSDIADTTLCPKL